MGQSFHKTLSRPGVLIKKNGVNVKRESIYTLLLSHSKKCTVLCKNNQHCVRNFPMQIIMELEERNTINTDVIPLLPLTTPGISLLW